MLCLQVERFFISYHHTYTDSSVCFSHTHYYRVCSTPLLTAALVAQRLKRLSGMQETQVRSLGREDPLEKENGNSLQYSCLENPMEGGAWQATVMGSQRAGQDFTFTFYDYISILYNYISPFNICCKASLMVVYSLNFCLSEILFISPSILNEILARYSNLGCRFFPLST